MATPEPRPEDFGEFAIQTSMNDDLKLIRASMDEARENPSNPGHHWHQVVVRRRSAEILATKVYHVDLNAGIVDITETRNGVEAARRTVRLADPG